MKGIQQRLQRYQKQQDQKYNKLLKQYEMGIGFDDIDYKQKKAQQKIQIGYGRLNPNDPADMRKIKRK